MLKSTLVCAILVAAANAQPPSPFGFSFGGRPSSASPFGGGPSTSSPFGGASSSPFGGPTSAQSSPFSSGPPSLIANLGPPRGSGSRPGSFPPQGSFSPPGFGKPPRQSSSSKLFNWLGNTMSKIPGLVPKIHYHNPSKSKPGSSSGGPPSYSGGPPSSFSSSGGPPSSFSSSGGPPSSYSSGGPPSSFSSSPSSGILSHIPNSILEDISSPYGGSAVSFAPSSGSPQHPQVKYRSPGGPPPSGFGGRPRGPFGSRSPFGSRPPPSFSQQRPSYSSGGPGGPSPFSGGPPSFGSPGSPFGGRPRPSSNPFPQNIRNNLEVFPSQQISYQSQTLNQNQPGYNEALGSLQNIYAQSSNKRPNVAATSHFEQQSSYSQQQPQPAAAPSASNNYGASFHSVEPVQVAPVYDVAQNFKTSSSELSGSESQQNSQQSQQQQQQGGNIHDTPFVSLVNDYAAQADADTSGSEQLISSLQGSSDSDLATSASTNIGFPANGMQIVGQGTSAGGNPMFEVVADANAPTYDGHPVDLNKLISMIEPGAQIDTMPSSYGETGAASEQQPMYAEAPADMDLQSDAMMSSGFTGNTNFKPSPLDPILQSLSSESRPTVVKPDGTSLNSDELIKDLKEHFDKDIIIDDLQESKDSGYIVLRMGPDNQTGDDERNPDLSLTEINGTLGSTLTRNDNNNLLAIVQQLRKSAVVNTLENPSFKVVVTQTEDSNSTSSEKTTQHPNHNYHPYPYIETSHSNDTKETSDSPPTPVINPILDSVRPSSRIRFTKTMAFSTTSDEDDSDMLPKDEHGNHDDDDIIEDGDTITNDTGDGDKKEDDDDYVDVAVDSNTTATDSDSEDMIVAASRNVKSVAIIVTPPPHYVKIRNKYKKASIPLSALTSTTTTTTSTTVPPSIADLTSTSTSSLKDDEFEIPDFDEIFSESLGNNNSNRNNSLSKNDDNDEDDSGSGSPPPVQVEDSSIPTTTTTTAPPVFTSLEKTSNSNDGMVDVGTDDATDTDTFLKSILSGFQNNKSSSSNSQEDVEQKTEQKKPRRYPVYRGRTSS